MHKVLLFLIIFVFINFSLARAEEVILTLDEALALSLRNNRDILLKAQDIEKAKAKIAEAQAELFPTFNFTGSKTYTRGLYAKDLPQTTTQATLKQYLYQGGKTINTIQQNEYKLAVSQALLDKTKSDTVLEVKKTFFTLFLAGELAGLNKGILSNTQAHLDFIAARFQNGEASESDVLKIKESVTDIEEVYHSSLNQVDSAASLLKNLLYLDDNITIKPEIKFSYEPMDIALELKNAYLDFKNALYALKTAAAQILGYQDNFNVTSERYKNGLSSSLELDDTGLSLKVAQFNQTQAIYDYLLAGVKFYKAIGE